MLVTAAASTAYHISERVLVPAPAVLTTLLQVLPALSVMLETVTALAVLRPIVATSMSPLVLEIEAGSVVAAAVSVALAERARAIDPLCR